MLHRAKAFTELENKLKAMQDEGKEVLSINEIFRIMFDTSYESLKKRTKGEDVAKVLSDFVNVTSCDSEGFIRAITSDHRTLQQSSFKLFIQCMEKWAEMYESELYDLRNEQTVILSKKITEAIKDEAIPFI